jgi:SulP family sulfate permease
MLTLYQNLKKQSMVLMLAGVQPGVQQMLTRGGLTDMIGAENIFWSADQAIVEAEKRGCAYCLEESDA